MTIKLYFDTIDEKTGKEGAIYCFIKDGSAIYQFKDHQQTEITYKKMLEDGKKVLLSRGRVIQFFTGKTAEEIKFIMKDDIEKAVENTKESKNPIKIANYHEEIMK